jgi:hypothetical protein
MEWHDLEHMTVVKLREVAHEKGLTSVSGKNKAELIEELAGVLGIEKPHQVLTDKTVHSKSDLKLQLRELKSQRAKLIEVHDHKGLKEVRRKAHGLKRQIRKIHLAAQAK